MRRSLAVLTILVAVLAASCTRGKKDQDKKPAEGEATKTGEPVTAAKGATAEWKEGKLPASMTEGEPKKGGMVNVQVYSEPPSLNIIVDSDWWAARLTQHHLMQALLKLDPYDHPNYEHVGELAERWTVSDDKKTITFHLRKNVKWHDGKPFTAKDVIATFDKVRDPTTKAVHMRSYLEELESYKALDDFTVEFKWKNPYFMALDSPFTDVPIQPAHVIADMKGVDYNEAAKNPLNRHPIGTGPFKFVTWESNQKIVYERNEDYWGKKPHLDRIVFRIVKESTIGLQLAERGELDVVTRITPEEWSQMDSPKTVSEFNRLRFFDHNYAWIGWNMERPFFKDAKVRKALTMLTDRPGIIEKLMYGLPKPTQCAFYWASPACPELEPIPFDPVSATKLLDEAGWKDTNNDGVRDKGGVKFAFTFMIPNHSQDAGRMATKMKEDFSRAGIEMALQQVEWSAYTKRLREHEFDACTLLWGSSGPRSDPTQIWHSNSIDGGSNYVSFRNAEADKLMEEARTIFDDDKRNAMYQKLGEILYREQPYTWLYVRPRMELYRKDLKGVRETLSYHQYSDWWLDSAPPAKAAAKPAAASPTEG